MEQTGSIEVVNQCNYQDDDKEQEEWLEFTCSYLHYVYAYLNSDHVFPLAIDIRLHYM